MPDNIPKREHIVDNGPLHPSMQILGAATLRLLLQRTHSDIPLYLSHEELQNIVGVVVMPAHDNSGVLIRLTTRAELEKAKNGS